MYRSACNESGPYSNTKNYSFCHFIAGDLTCNSGFNFSPNCQFVITGIVGVFTFFWLEIFADRTPKRKSNLLVEMGSQRGASSPPSDVWLKVRLFSGRPKLWL